MKEEIIYIFPEVNDFLQGNNLTIIKLALSRGRYGPKKCDVAQGHRRRMASHFRGTEKEKVYFLLSY
jgi:hypothetical protein